MSEYQGPYECAEPGCGAVIDMAEGEKGVSLLATVPVRKPNGEVKPNTGSFLFCQECAGRRLQQQQ